jgi:hypothetical protein
MLCGVTFGGVGFLESKDHLWIIKSSPRGVSNFVKARLLESFLFGIPMVILPVSIVSLVLSLDVTGVLIVSVHSYLILVGSVLVGVGITSMNPAYEDTRSSAFHMNTFAAIGVTMILMMLGLVWGIILGFEVGLIFLGIFVSSIPLLITGMLILAGGVMRLGMLEA